MNRRALVFTLISAVGWASIISLFTESRQALSIKLWLAAFAAIFAWKLLSQLGLITPLLPNRRLAFMRGRRSVADNGARRDPHLASLLSMLLRARDNDRVFTQRLRPRLTELARHFLRLHHGVDIDRDPVRVTNVLGDVAWLVDESVPTRAPTVAELERFMHRLVPTPDRGDTQ